jgi:hypothetical protein
LKRETFFSRFFPSIERRRNRSLQVWHAETQDYSWGKITLVSDFLQLIAEVLLFGRLNLKAARVSRQSLGLLAFSAARGAK